MKKTTTRISTLLLAAVISMSMLASCTSKPGEGKENTLPKDNTSGTIAKGKMHKIKILASETNNNTFFKMVERTEYPVWTEFDNHAKEMGVEFDFEIVPHDQYEVIIKTRMSSANDLPDIVSVGDLDVSSLLNLGKKGIIQPINDIVENFSDGTAKEFYGKGGVGEFSQKSNTAFDGNVYWFSSVASGIVNGKSAASTQGIAIRKDWLDKLKMAETTTTEEYLSAMKAFRDKDVNGNKLKDEVLVGSITTFANGIAQWFGLVNTTTASLDFDAKKVVSPWYQPGVKEYFNYMNRLYKEGILDPTAKEDQANAANAMASVYTYALQTWLEPATGVADAAFLPLKPLKAVEGIAPLQIQGAPQNSISWSRYAFTKNCTDKEGMGKVLDIVSSEYFRTLSEWGIEGTHYEVVDGKYKSLIIGKSWEDSFKEKSPTGYMLWGFGAFPRMDWNNNWDATLTPEGGLPDYKIKFQIESLTDGEKGNLVYADVSSYYSLPTDEQLAQIEKISSDLNTYCAELSTKLIIGEASLDKWDSYIAELKELGLDDLIAIYQEQYDRYLKS